MKLGSKHEGCPHLARLKQQQLAKGSQNPINQQDDTPPIQDTMEFGPSMPIIDGEVQIPSFGQVLKSNLIPHKPYKLPPLTREEIGLSPLGPNGKYVKAGNQWPNEKTHPLFPEFKQLSGPDKQASIAHFAHASRRRGKLEPLGQYGITKNPQLIVDPNGMRWPFEVSAQTAAAIPREKNMHGRGAWGEIEIVPNADPKKRINYGVLKAGGVGDMRLSLGAEQNTNVVGGALGIPLGPNAEGVESANLLMLSGPGPQLDDLDFFAKPLSTVAMPDENTPTLFKVLDHGFKAAAESGVRPGNHMFRYNQDGEYTEDVDIPAQVDLAPNPKLSLHKLAPLGTQNVDGVDGEAVRDEFKNLRAPEGEAPIKVLDLALSEALIEGRSDLPKGRFLTLDVKDSEGNLQKMNCRVAEQSEAGTRLEFLKPTKEAQMAIYESMDLIYEMGRRIKPGDHLYTINIQTQDGKWKNDVAKVMAKSEFFPSAFADHQRLYGHTERPDSTPALRKGLTGVRWVTGSLADGLTAWSFDRVTDKKPASGCPFAHLHNS